VREVFFFAGEKHSSGLIFPKQNFNPSPRGVGDQENTYDRKNDEKQIAALCLNEEIFLHYGWFDLNL
jgi:hypothetical protein